jgi:hypothetical protein
MTVGRIPSVEGGIQPTLLTTKGDIIVATGDATLVRQGVGANGTVLTANSAQADGVEWATPTSGMTLISTTTLSGATTTISSIPQTYERLMAFIELPRNDTADGLFRIAPNGSLVDTYMVGVKIATTVFDMNSGYIGTLSTTNRNTVNFSATMIIDNYARTATIKACQYYGWYAPSAGVGPFMMAGIVGSVPAITSLVFSNTGGNLTSGTVYLYGVK